jgi:hypothetical protein
MRWLFLTSREESTSHVVIFISMSRLMSWRATLRRSVLTQKAALEVILILEGFPLRLRLFQLFRLGFRRWFGLLRRQFRVFTILRS